MTAPKYYEACPDIHFLSTAYRKKKPKNSIILQL